MYQIALVDDNEAWCFALQAALLQQDFAASAFTDPHEFLQVAHQFDLALIDFSLPVRSFKLELDGSQVITQAKQQLRHPPFLVLMSSFFTDDAIAQSLCPDADAYLSKNMSLAEIIEFVRVTTFKQTNMKHEPMEARLRA